MASDLKQTNSDLASEEKDAAAGPNADGGDCYNLQQNVEYDAQQNVDYDLQQNQPRHDFSKISSLTSTPPELSRTIAYRPEPLRQAR